MTITPQPADNDDLDPPRIPDVTGLSLMAAALAYAQHGGAVLPVKVGKHPGSIVGRGWPELSTSDPDVIDCYWDGENPPGIALHTGKSNLIAFDLDVDVLPNELIWLKTGLFQSSRGGRGDRGHYLFATAETFVSGDLKLSDGRAVGDIRSGNTVIVVEPSPHANGGEYLWRTTGIVPPLSEAARPYLRLLGTARAGWSGAFEASNALVAEAISGWIGNSRPKALAGPVNSVRNHIAGTGTWRLTRDGLRIAASEARIGFYPLQTAVEEFRSAMMQSYRKRAEPQKFDQHEFSRLVANGVGYALSRSVKEIMAEAYGDYGTGHREGFSLYRQMRPRRPARPKTHRRLAI